MRGGLPGAGGLASDPLPREAVRLRRGGAGLGREVPGADHPRCFRSGRGGGCFEALARVLDHVRVAAKWEAPPMTLMRRQSLAGS